MGGDAGMGIGSQSMREEGCGIYGVEELWLGWSNLELVGTGR